MDDMQFPGTIAVTDPEWYQFLSGEKHRAEVNFWTPSARRGFRAPPFSPFLFKLRYPHNAIAGFGYFAQYSKLPEWLAWECFGEGNGSPSLGEFQSRLNAIRRGYRYVETDAQPLIGCIVVVDVTFFDEKDWIPQPADWPVRTQRAKRYDLAVGEGRRVWQECLARAEAARRTVARDDLRRPVAMETDARYGSPVEIRPRLGQGAFRVAVTDAYNRACAVTREHSLPALEAAHIRPYAKCGEHDVRNGLLLRADLHRLFELGYVTVTTEHIVEVSRRLRDDYANGRTYYPLHGSTITTPAHPSNHPDPQLLEWHNEHVYLG